MISPVRQSGIQTYLVPGQNSAIGQHAASAVPAAADAEKNPEIGAKSCST